VISETPGGSAGGPPSAGLEVSDTGVAGLRFSF
jgi:hypothetical protein